MWVIPEALQTGKDFVLNRALLWSDRFCYLPKQFLKQLWNLQDWISDSVKVECGSGGYSCLSLDEILILMYDYIFEEQWFPLWSVTTLIFLYRELIYQLGAQILLQELTQS